MRETGRLVKIENGRGIVRLQHRGGCDKCGLSAVCNPAGEGTRELSLPIEENNFSPGDLVEIETSPRSLIMAAFVVFILPLLISISVYALITMGTGREHLALLFFFIAFGIAELIVGWLDKKIGRNRFFEPKIVNKQGI